MKHNIDKRKHTKRKARKGKRENGNREKCDQMEGEERKTIP